MSLLLLFETLAVTSAINSRESIETLEAQSGPGANNSREAIEVLYNIFVEGINSRESLETLWQTSVNGIDARLSIEILENNTGAKTRWGAISM